MPESPSRQYTVSKGPYEGRIVASRGAKYYYESEKPRAEQIRAQFGEFVPIRAARQLTQKPRIFESDRGARETALRGSPVMSRALLGQFEGLMEPRIALRFYDGNRWYQTLTYDSPELAYQGFQALQASYDIGDVLEIEAVSFS